MLFRSHRTRAFAEFKAECLDHLGQSSTSNKAAGRDMAALTAAAANLSTKEELCRFISNLRADLHRNKSNWKHQTLEGYLNALEANLADTSLSQEPQWRVIAKALLAAGGNA